MHGKVARGDAPVLHERVVGSSVVGLCRHIVLKELQMAQEPRKRPQRELPGIAFRLVLARHHAGRLGKVGVIVH